MGCNLRYPNITAPNEREQLVQIKSYLHQLVDDLQWAMNNIETPKESTALPVSRSQYSVNKLTPADGQATFDAIKGLIIKSADIVDAYYEKINSRLASVYVASSNFGTYTEEMVREIEEASSGVNETFYHLQEISNSVDSSLGTLTDSIDNLDSALKDTNTNLENEIQALKLSLDTLNFTLVEVTANIRSGLLYYDDAGIPVYGLEVGQKNIVDGEEVFNKFARFTAGRLSFYDQNSAEVAYISDYKLYITHAEITGTLKLGGYHVDTTNGLAFKWVGRG